jgi:hypothetical protein
MTLVFVPACTDSSLHLSILVVFCGMTQMVTSTGTTGEKYQLALERI